ncbi:MAG: hypothetical protein F6J87_20425 [Spirulina sp. SIO3F2]|nr:hypothetical protein [Spirulina sp. SIO3F2]
MAMDAKITKLADLVRMAARSYDAGKRETALKLISLVASKINTAEEQHQLELQVERDISSSGIETYFRSIILGSGGTFRR